MFLSKQKSVVKAYIFIYFLKTNKYHIFVEVRIES